MLRFPDHGARLSLQVLMELRGRIVPLPPCLDETCTCHGVFYKDVCTTSCRTVAIVQLNWEGTDLAGPRAAEIRAAFREAPPSVVVSHAGKGVTTIVGGVDFEVEATFAEATATTPDQWVLFFRPNITTERRNALCHLRVGVGAAAPDGEPANFVDLDMEIRSKPSAWLVVENIPETWDMQALENFLRHFCEPTTIRCTTHAKFTAFVQLAKRSLATGIMDGWSRQAPALLARLDAEDLVVSWTMNLNQPCAADQPFAPGSGWKAPSHCRIGRVYQDGGNTDVPAAGGPVADHEHIPVVVPGVVAPPAEYPRNPRKHGRAAAAGAAPATVFRAGDDAAAFGRAAKRQRHTAPEPPEPTFADDADFDFDALMADLDVDIGDAAPFDAVPVDVFAGAGAGAGAGAMPAVEFETIGNTRCVLPTFLPVAPAPFAGSPAAGHGVFHMEDESDGDESDAASEPRVVLPLLPVAPYRTSSPGAGSPAALMHAWTTAAATAGILV